VPDGVASFTCGCAIDREAGSTAEGARACFAAGAARRFALNVSSRQLKPDTSATHGRVAGGASNVATLERRGDRCRRRARYSSMWSCVHSVSNRALLRHAVLFWEQAIGTWIQTEPVDDQTTRDGDYAR